MKKQMYKPIERDNLYVVQIIFQTDAIRTKKFLVAMRLWDTPVLIPNTMVKT